MRRLLQGITIFILLIVISVVACAIAVILITGKDPVTAAREGFLQFTLSMRRDELYTPAGSSDQPVRFVVEPASSASQIANNLYSAQLITDPTLFVNYVAANNLDVQLEAGTYFLYNSQSIPEIAVLLTDSNSSQLPFRILEGWRMEEIAAAIDSNHLFGFTGSEFLSVVGPGANIPQDFAAYVDLPPGASLEGFLYPDTYLLPPAVTPTGLRDILLDTFRQRVSVDLVNDARNQNLSIYEAVILASIAEREAVHSEEFPLIMSVYRNRLDIGMTLDADPTVQYALGNTRGTWWAQISRSDYTGVRSPYNTYVNLGLPPGPISNPGIAAIEAAIHPQESDYLYFRAVCDQSGYHEFALTYEEHLQNGCTG